MGVPSTEQFQPLSVEGIAPSSGDFKEPLKNPWPKDLNCSDDLRDCGAVQEELGAEGMVRIAVSEDDVGQRW